MLPGWRYAGGSPSATSDEIIAKKATWPKHKRICLDLCIALLSGWYPAPEQDHWVLFGFCVCRDEWNEKAVSQESSSLITLLDSRGLQTERKKIVHLEDVLEGSPRSFKSVWYLKQVVAARDIAVTSSVAVDYGFVNCRGDNEELVLKESYKRYFEHPDGNPVRLHEAAIAGKTLECIEGVVKLNKKDHKTLQRLMNNPYPLPAF